MDIQSKREEILGLIDKIKEHSDRLKQTQNISTLELSVILSKITQLHEKTLILKYLAAVDQNHAVEEFGLKSDIENKEVNPPEFIKPQKTDKKGDSKKETASAEHLEEIAKGNKERKTDFEEIEKKQELDSKPDLNEAFTEEEDPSLSGQLRKQPIQDLLTAIGLNERYLYANELFDGNIEDFREAIRRLNEFDNVAEAKAFFNDELTRAYEWEDDNQMAKALYLLVERRYN